MTTQDIEIKNRNGEQSSAKVTLELQSQSDSLLTIEISDGQKFSAVGKDAFSALRKIRKDIESLGIILLIQGCRPNCWPSGMSGQMSNGTKIYDRQLNMNEFSSWKLVNTFDPAIESELGTLADQDEFNNRLKEIIKNVR
jgi:hypothetical protein